MFPAWDGDLLIWFQEVTSHPWLDRFFPFYTMLGNIGGLWIAIGFLLIIFKKTRVTGLLLLLSLLLTHLINNLVLKQLILRPRPYEVLSEVRNLIGPQHETSFPSGHSATAFGSAMIVVFREKGWLRWTTLVLAILMPLSRLYVGVHYPTDVLAGSLVGTIIAGAVVLVAKQVGDRRKLKKI